MTNNKAYCNEFRPELIKHLVNQIQKGETSAFIGMPGVGGTNAIYWIKKRCCKSNSIIPIHIDLNNLVSLKELAFYRLLLLETKKGISFKIKDKELLNEVNEIYTQNISSQDDLLTFDALKSIVEYVVDAADQVICFIFDGIEKLREMDKSVFNSLIALRKLDKTKVVFLFVGKHDIENIFPSDKAGDLLVLLNYNLHWLRLLNKEETNKLINEFCNLLETKLDKKSKDIIWTLSAGHAWYIKLLTKVFSEKTSDIEDSLEKIAKYSSIKIRSKQIWSSFSDNHKVVLKKIIKNPDQVPSDIPEYLQETGIIKVNKKSVKVFSPLFENYILTQILHKSTRSEDNTSRKKIKKKGLSLDQKTREIIKNGKPIDHPFTKNEFKLIKYFFDHESLAMTRDDIAGAIWGNDTATKYSDWAIDKIISRIREKIEDNSRDPQYLVTLRGVGFKFFSTID